MHHIYIYIYAIFDCIKMYKLILEEEEVEAHGYIYMYIEVFVSDAFPNIMNRNTRK